MVDRIESGSEQGKMKWVVEATMNIWVPWNVGNLLTEQLFDA
jgi:hypothetical protein